MQLTRAKPAILGALVGLAVAAGIMFTPPLASARAYYESPYGFDRTWNASLRLVRVDMAFNVTEKDEPNGYFLFDYRSPESGEKSTPGSVELVRGRDADSPVRVIVQLPQMPRYHEQVIADALALKMRTEYGDPPPRKKKQPVPLPDQTPDAGPDGSDQP